MGDWHADFFVDFTHTSNFIYWNGEAFELWREMSSDSASNLTSSDVDGTSAAKTAPPASFGRAAVLCCSLFSRSTAPDDEAPLVPIAVKPCPAA